MGKIDFARHDVVRFITLIGLRRSLRKQVLEKNERLTIVVLWKQIELNKPIDMQTGKIINKNKTVFIAHFVLLHWRALDLRFAIVD